MADESYISATIADVAAFLHTKDGSVAYGEAIDWLNEFVTNTKTDYLKLSRTHPDYESIRQQLIAALRERPAWKEVITTSVGGTIIRFVATVGDYAQTSILRAYQEGHLDSARLTSSIYTITRSFGVHIDRKIPMTVKAQLWSDNQGISLGNSSIPSYSQFVVGGIAFFNRETIVFNNNTADHPLTVTLYQGEVQQEGFISNGSAFQSYEIGYSDYNISSSDVLCYLEDGTEFVRTEEGLWFYDKNNKVFFENTTPNGNVEILFGNGFFGAIPPVNSTFFLIYVITAGSIDPPPVEAKAGLAAINTVVPDRIRRDSTEAENNEIQKLQSIVTGKLTAILADGQNERDKEFYRKVAPGIRASRGIMSNRQSHFALGVKYPGLADALFQGQRELARDDRNYINVVGVTVLKNNLQLMTDEQWFAYTDYLDSLGIWRVNWLRIDPTPVTINVEAKVFCTLDSNITNVGNFLEYRFRQLFTPRIGLLGYSIYRNDVEDLLKYSYGDMKINYAQVQSPTIDYILTKTQYPVLGTCDIEVNYSSRSYNAVPPRILS